MVDYCFPLVLCEHATAQMLHKIFVWLKHTAWMHMGEKCGAEKEIHLIKFGTKGQNIESGKNLNKTCTLIMTLGNICVGGCEVRECVFVAKCSLTTLVCERPKGKKLKIGREI